MNENNNLGDLFSLTNSEIMSIMKEELIFSTPRGYLIDFYSY